MVFLLFPLTFIVITLTAKIKKWKFDYNDVDGSVWILFFIFALCFTMIWLLIAGIQTYRIIAYENDVEYYSEAISKLNKELAEQCNKLWKNEPRTFLYGLSGRRDYGRILSYQDKIYEAQRIKIEAIRELNIRKRLGILVPRFIEIK